MMIIKLAKTAVAVAALGATFAGTLAQARQPGQGFVTAESRFGHGTLRGAVRPGKWGPQVQTPGGNWLDCRRLCSETLRVETIDFWENHGSARSDNEAGIFGPLRIERGW